jgi:hypothetical protein
MPAGSEAPRTYRPLGPIVMGVAVTVALVAVVTAGWVTFDDETRAKFTDFQRGTLAFFGLIYLGLMFTLLRSRVTLYADHLVIVNGYKRRSFEYAQVVAARLPPGAPWVTLDLADGDTVSVLAIQQSDGARAKRALRELRGHLV